MENVLAGEIIQFRRGTTIYSCVAAFMINYAGHGRYVAGKGGIGFDIPLSAVLSGVGNGRQHVVFEIIGSGVRLTVDGRDVGNVPTDLMKVFRELGIGNVEEAVLGFNAGQVLLHDGNVFKVLKDEHDAALAILENNWQSIPRIDVGNAEELTPRL